MLPLKLKFAKAPDVSPTTFLHKLFDGCEDTGDGISILDVGAGSPSTLAFFNQYRCRVHFLDLYDLDLSSAADAEQAQQRFTQVLSDYQGTLFDACLFWDFLHRIDAAALCGLSNALRPYVYSSTRAYSVCNVFASNWRKNYTYRLRDLDQLQLQPTGDAPLSSWSQSQFEATFDCFHVIDDALSEQGRLELLMVAD